MLIIMDCIFCEILDGKRNGHLLYEDDSHVAFLDKYPIDVGHSLIIPRTHHERITDMDSENVGKIFSLVPKIANAIFWRRTNGGSIGGGHGRWDDGTASYTNIQWRVGDKIVIYE